MLLNYRAQVIITIKKCTLTQCTITFLTVEKFHPFPWDLLDCCQTQIRVFFILFILFCKTVLESMIFHSTFHFMIRVNLFVFAKSQLYSPEPLHTTGAVLHVCVEDVSIGTNAKTSKLGHWRNIGRDT